MVTNSNCQLWAANRWTLIQTVSCKLLMDGLGGLTAHVLQSINAKLLISSAYMWRTLNVLWMFNSPTSCAMNDGFSLATVILRGQGYQRPVPLVETASGGFWSDRVISGSQILLFFFNLNNGTIHNTFTSQFTPLLHQLHYVMSLHYITTCTTFLRLPFLNPNIKSIILSQGES